MAWSAQIETDVAPSDWFDSNVFHQRAEAAGSLVLHLSSAPPDARGRLCAFLSGEIERLMQRAGASPRPEFVTMRREDMLGDQLYRARLLGCRGLAIAFGSLNAIAKDGVLHAEDSETLRWWMSDAASSELSLLFPETAAALKAYSTPVLLPQLAADKNTSEKVDAPESLGSGTEALSMFRRAASQSEIARLGADPPPRPINETCPPSAEASSHDSGPTSSPEPRKDSSFRTAMREALCGPDESPRSDEENIFFSRSGTGHPQQAVAEPLPIDELENPRQRADHGDTPTYGQELAESFATAPCPAVAPPESVTPTASRSHDNEPDRRPSLTRQCTTEATQRRTTPDDNDDHRLLLAALKKTNGEQSWTSLERLFTEAFTPLQHALMENRARDEVREALEGWSREFSGSYSTAFDQLKTRGRRPPMVFDAPNLAFRIGRRLGVKYLRLIMIDSLRFDIAESAQSKLELQLSGSAKLVDKGLLWSAVPCTTSVQLELLARGAAGLRSLEGSVAEADIVSKSHEARQLRPMRVGPHRILKLDAVRAERERNPIRKPEDLQRAAAEVAVSVGRFLRQQAPNTLAFFFGDHGFSTLPNETGVACPERALVPFQAWLVSSSSEAASHSES